MKCTKKILIALSVVAILAISGSAYAVTRLSFGTGPIGMVFHPMGSGIATIINENVPGVSVSIQSTVGGPENVRLASIGEIDLGLSPADNVFLAMHNQEPFAGEDIYIETLGALHATVFQIVTLRSSGIQEFEQLRGRRIAVGEPGSAPELSFRLALEAKGWTENDVTMVYLPPEQAMDQLADGLLDAVCVQGGIPTPAITGIAIQNDIELINFTPLMMERLMEIAPFLSFIELGPEHYRGLDRVITTSAQRAMLIVRPGLDEELAYQITRAVYENLEQLETFHAAAATISLEAAPTVFAPLNPGAERFFREVGLLE